MGNDLSNHGTDVYELGALALVVATLEFLESVSEVFGVEHNALKGFGRRQPQGH